MQVVSNPSLAPGVCFVCNGKPPETEWIDSYLTFEPGGYTSLNGRKYVCGVCVDTMARLIGYEKASQVKAAQEKAEVEKARYYALVNRITLLVGDLDDLTRNPDPQNTVVKKARGRPKKNAE